MKRLIALILFVLLSVCPVWAFPPTPPPGTAGAGDVTGPTTPTAGNLTKWGPSGKALVDGPKIGTFTDLKWCSFSTAGGLQCTEAVPQVALTYPVTGVVSPTAGYLTKWGTSGNAIVDGPKIGTFTDTKWCSFSTANGLQCTENAPTTTTLATDTLWDAAGDMVQGTGSNTAGRTAIGTAGQAWTVNAGATAGEWSLPIPIVAAGGDVTNITANYTPDVTLTNMRIVAFVASGANTSTTPTFAPDGLTAHTIVRHGGQALVAGDIPAALAVCILQYNLANTRWELLNPAQPPATLNGTFTLSNGATPGSIYFQEGSGGGTDKVQVIGPATVTAGGRVQTIKDETGNICTDGSVCTGYAPLASPTFTGTVTAPILTVGTINGVASTSFVTGPASPTINQLAKFSATGPTPITNSTIVEDGTDVNIQALNLVSTGSISGTAKILTVATGLTIGSTPLTVGTDRVAYGGAIFVTTTSTIVLPAVSIGMGICFYSVGQYVVTITPNASDGIRSASATRGTDGHTITNGAAAAGEFACLLGDSADGWTVFGKSGTWTVN
jgi:hypothetical protein